MNNKGVMLIETSFVVVLLLLLCTISEAILRGWHYRIQNRISARYASTYHLRQKAFPTAGQINTFFYFQSTHQLDLMPPDRVGLSFKSLLHRQALHMKHPYYLRRPSHHDSLFKSPF